MTTQTHNHSHFDHEETHSTDWRGWAKALLFLGLGLELAFLMVTNTITYYISPHFAWLTIVASVLLVFFGALTAIDLWRGNQHHHHHHDHDHHDHEHHDHDHDCNHDHHHYHDHDHDHQHEEITWAILAVIAVPLILAVLFPAMPLTADSVNGGISMTSVGVSQEDIEAIPTTERNIIQWLRLFEESDDLTVFENQTVDVIGFVYNEPSFGDDHTMVVRFAISCCVADALAIGLPINITEVALPEQGVWIRVRGTFEMGEFDGIEMPIIIPQTIEPIDMPEDPYLYT